MTIRCPRYHKTSELAEKHALSLVLAFPFKAFRVYRCQRCDGWHVGRKKK